MVGAAVERNLHLLLHAVREGGAHELIALVEPPPAAVERDLAQATQLGDAA